MDLSFSWLRNTSSLSLTELVSPAASTFTIAQPSELEDASEFIQPHALVLTVGIAFKDRPEKLGNYIDHLADAGAVAVGFGTGLTFAEVPELVIDTARRRGLGLYEVPRRIPFISIITAIHQEQQRRQSREQQLLIDAQERLTTSAIPGSMEGLLRESAQLFGARVRLFALDRSMVAEAQSVDFDPAVSARTVTHRLAHGSLEVRSARSIPPALIRHCAGLADMLLARPVELRNARNELNAFALALRFNLLDATTSLPASLSTPTSEDGLTRPVVVSADQSRALERARAALDSDAQARGQFLYATSVGADSFLVLFHPSHSTAEILSAFGPAGRRVRVVIGRPVLATKLDAEHIRSLQTRCLTLALGDHALPGSAEVSWLAEPAVAQALRTQREELLGRLEHEDNLRGTEYARTLTVFLRHNAQLSATAEALGIHRHTVRARMAKIQDLCEIDLSDPATVAQAYFAVAVD